jgi:hypothetical protein
LARDNQLSDSDPQPPPTGDQSPADEEELQRRLEEQLRQIRVQDLLLESVASILNLSARRIAKEDERDLEQGRIGIDAVRSVLELLDEGPREQVREALSQVQMLYVRETRGGGEPPQGGGGEPAQGPPAPGPERKGPEPPPRLWTPGSS